MFKISGMSSYVVIVFILGIDRILSKEVVTKVSLTTSFKSDQWRSILLRLRRKRVPKLEVVKFSHTCPILPSSLSVNKVGIAIPPPTKVSGVEQTGNTSCVLSGESGSDLQYPRFRRMCLRRNPLQGSATDPLWNIQEQNLLDPRESLPVPLKRWGSCGEVGYPWSV